MHTTEEESEIIPPEEWREKRKKVKQSQRPVGDCQKL